ncbi:MAG: X-Pro aminopeptidase [Acidocella sp. 20-57-95]|nr:MAG: X-Pro aminopeptidase [Acidocella sp. 20-57-95]
MMKLEHSSRIKALRAKLTEAGLDGFIIPRADEHLGEYVPKSAERLAYISGFTGSAGLAIVLAEKAAIFSDGRYTLQLTTETDGNIWERLHISEQPPEAWLKANAADKLIGYDPMLISADALNRFSAINMVATAVNPLDAIWHDRPPAPMAPAIPHGIEYAGESSADKRDRLAQILKNDGEDAAILTDPSSLAWLFNIRGADVEFTPLALGFALLKSDASAILFMDPAKIPAETMVHLGPDVTVATRDHLQSTLAAFTGRKVRYDPASMPVWFKTTLESAGATISPGTDPAALPRACKNETEQAGTRAAHLRDGVAMARFLAWFAQAAPRGSETEISAASKLLACRAMGDNFKGESFPAISGAGPDGAIIHYRVSAATNRTLNPNEVYLIDSGGQYLDGTTDITRTLWTGPGPAPAEVKEHFTRVLAGHIALAEAAFPEGVAGLHLDVLARNALWQAGLDYDHGTGHGVGAYLSVHEGPAGISRAAKPVPLQAGMILSNEPGFYLPGHYGIRLENLLMVQPAAFPGTERKFLHFETLTLAPFDLALVAPEFLSASALEWLNLYHARVRLMLGAHLHPDHDAEVLTWLKTATRPI